MAQGILLIVTGSGLMAIGLVTLIEQKFLLELLFRGKGRPL